jgi:hypothetical protein
LHGYLRVGDEPFKQVYLAQGFVLSLG